MTAPYPFAAVLFDLDGVVVDTMPLHRRVWGEWAASKGFPVAPERLREFDGRRAHDIIPMIFGPDLSEAFTTDLAAEREQRYRQALERAEIAPVAGIAEYLAALGALGVPRILATSAIPENVEIVLTRLGLQGAFEARVTAPDVHRGKPDPEIYQTAAERAGVPPGQCLVVEDALPGVRSAKAAGAKCLGLTTSESMLALRQAGADYAAPDFLNLPAVLRPAIDHGDST